MKIRADEGMPFLLKYEHVAWFENGVVRMLDRRIYPTEIVFVTCTTHQEVAQAIADMVTQSAGPYTAAGMGMALAAYQVAGQTEKQQIQYLQQASETLANARPTTANRMRQITQNCVAVALEALAEGKNVSEAIVNTTLASLERRYTTMEKVGQELLQKVPDKGAILTQCFGETIIGTFLRGAKAQGKTIHLYCAETRPFLQGARLTASCGIDLGFETTVITDNMVGYCLECKPIDFCTSAADTITRDGYIANKIGTKQMALLAKHYQVPYYVTGIPDGDKPTASSIVIEERDPSQVLNFFGKQLTLAGVQAIYPSFDVTPPELISGVVTDRGVYPANQLKNYFNQPVERFY